MNKFNFNSAICTNRVQSERLLTLGLRKETADMHYCMCDDGDGSEYPILLPTRNARKKDIPAWSLHRLICMLPEEIVIDGYSYNLCIDNDSICHLEYSACTCDHFVRCESLYDAIVGYIEWLIKEGYFNKEYLV